jgi:hypothetical protein
LDVIGGAAIGFAVGAAVHLILGAPGGSPSAGRVRRALVDSGFEPAEVVAQGRPDARRSARFLATTVDGERLFVKFIPRERRDWDLAYRAWRGCQAGGERSGALWLPSEQMEREAYSCCYGRHRWRAGSAGWCCSPDCGAGLLVMGTSRGGPG